MAGLLEIPISKARSTPASQPMILEHNVFLRFAGEMADFLEAELEEDTPPVWPSSSVRCTSDRVCGAFRAAAAKAPSVIPCRPQSCDTSAKKLVKTAASIGRLREKAESLKVCN